MAQSSVRSLPRPCCFPAKRVRSCSRSKASTHPRVRVSVCRETLLRHKSNQSPPNSSFNTAADQDGSGRGERATTLCQLPAERMELAPHTRPRLERRLAGTKRSPQMVRFFLFFQSPTESRYTHVWILLDSLSQSLTDREDHRGQSP